MSKHERSVIFLELNRSIQILFAAFLITVSLYLARVVFEPIVFALFGMALVWPFQKALEARLPKSAALGLTILLVVSVISTLAAGIVWSIDDVVHWTVVNIARFQAIYERWVAWLEGYGIYIAEGLGQYNANKLI